MTSKLTEEELKEISQLEQDYAQIKISIGEIIIQIEEMEDKFEALQDEKGNHMKTYSIIRQRDKDLSAKLTQKYGYGVVDMSTGEINVN